MLRDRESGKNGKDKTEERKRKEKKNAQDIGHKQISEKLGGRGWGRQTHQQTNPADYMQPGEQLQTRRGPEMMARLDDGRSAA